MQWVFVEWLMALASCRISGILKDSKAIEKETAALKRSVIPFASKLFRVYLKD